MARFDLYLRPMGGFFLDCQADLLGSFSTRLIVPLLPLDQAPRPAARLNPVFDIGGRKLAMVTQFAAAVPIRELGRPVGSLSAEQDAIGTALDMLISGF